MPLEAVTFDFHDTLMRCDRWFEVEVYTLVPEFLAWLHAAGHAASAAALHSEGQRVYRELRRGVMANGIERDATACVAQVLAELDLSVDDSLIDAGLEAIMSATLDDACPVPGAREAVRALAGAGIPLAVVSSAIYHPFLEWSLERFGMLNSFDVIVTSARCGFYKSRPDIYYHALRALNRAPDAVVHIGDSYEFDVLGAQRAGLRTVWLNQSSTTATNGAADLTVDNLHGLAPRLMNHFSSSSHAR